MNMQNPFSFCPQCKSEDITFNHNKHFICSGCGFEYFQNIAAAAGVIIHDNERFITLERAIEPGKGLYSLPGGFLDINESAEEGAVRECFEETGIKLNLDDLEFIASRPNTYEYKNIVYNTCDIIFSAYTEKLYIPETPNDHETSHIFAMEFAKLDVGKFAFRSVRDILDLWVGKNFLNHRDNL